MSIEIREKITSIPEVTQVDIDKIDVHGERATKVVATLQDGRTVTGTFTTESKPGFGGVVFSSRKDIGSLMTSKINSVLAGTAEIR